MTSIQMTNVLQLILLRFRLSCPGGWGANRGSLGFSFLFSHSTTESLCFISEWEVRWENSSYTILTYVYILSSILIKLRNSLKTSYNFCSNVFLWVLFHIRHFMLFSLSWWKWDSSRQSWDYESRLLLLCCLSTTISFILDFLHQAGDGTQLQHRKMLFI